MSMESEKFPDRQSPRSRKQKRRAIREHFTARNVRAGGTAEAPWEYERRLTAQSDLSFAQDLEGFLSQVNQLLSAAPSDLILQSLQLELIDIYGALKLLSEASKTPSGAREALFQRFESVEQKLSSIL